MIVVLTVSFIIIFLTFLSNYKKINKVLLISFCILFIFQAIRYDFGNDYLAYLESFYKIKSLHFDYNTIKQYATDYEVEIGYVYLVKIFPFDNFFLFVAFWSLFNCIAYYSLIKNYVPEKYYWFALFLYLFYPSGMMIQMSAFRQTIAIWFLIWAFKFLVNRSIFKYLILVFVGGTIHSSCFILLPFYFLGNEKIYKPYFIYLFIGVCILFFFADFTLRANVAPLINEYFVEYSYTVSDYTETKLRDTGLIETLVQLLLLGLILFSFQYGQITEKKQSILAAFFVLFSQLVSVIFLIDRIAMYFFPFVIITLPIAIKNIKNSLVKYGCLLLITSYFFKQFMGLFISDTWKDHFIIYRTIFESQ